ncbi:MAG: hypothetical protein HRU76_03590 [Phycisphaeraceae bacterium]|nr:hypothetical protein [Phycisphaerales bacterium]QOJ16724.1 MAG: hypothetical protein HRU76_03590 [Phycisphaeraceae bacterium]
MPIAHVCVKCGSDLSRRRARREPHYGLWIVPCDGCGAVAVRQRHEITSGILHIHRLHMALEALLLKTLVSAGLLTLAVIAAWGVSVVLPPRIGLRMEEAVGVCFAALVVLPFATGIWLSTAFTHHRRWKVWLTWWTIPAALLIIGYVAYALTWPGMSLPRNMGATGQEYLDLRRQDGWREMLLLLGVGLPACIVMGLVSWSGVPAGRLINWVLSHARRWRWRWIRARRRRLLQST